MKHKTNISRAADSACGKKCRSWMTVLAFLSAWVAVPQTGWAAGPWYVDPAGNDSNDCLSPATACLTISAAITKASAGDTVNVAAGTYAEQVIIGKGLTIVGDELNPANVVIDGQNAALPLSDGQVRIYNATGPVVFKGFRIINAGTKSGTYFGILTKGAQPVTVQNCQIIGHGATVPLGEDYGMWAYTGAGALVISGSYFAELYHAILLEQRYGTSTLENNTFDALFTGLYGDGNIYGGRAIEAIVYGTTDVTALQTIRGNQFLNFRSTGVQFSGGFSGQTPRKFTNVLIEKNNFDFLTTDIINLNGAILLQNISTPSNDDPAGGVTAEVRNNTVHVPSGNGIIVKGLNGTINIHDNSISGNLTNGVKADQSLGPIVKATGNWWGNASGPTHASNPDGTGDAVTGNIDYSPWREADYLAPDKTLLAHPWSWGVNTSNSSTIQEGIDAATAADTVHVRAGTYQEQVSINKALTVSGADGAVLDGTGLVPQWTVGVNIRSGNVTFDNIDVTNYTQDGITAYDNIDMPNLHITNLKVSNIQPGHWGFGIYIGYESEGWGYNPPDLTQHLDFSGLLIEGNEIVNTHSSGLVLQAITGTPGTLVVRDNYIHGITLNDAVWVDCARELTIENNIMADSRWGIEFSCIAEAWYTPDGPYGPKNIAMQCNQITGNTEFAVGWWNAWLATIVLDSNSIQGNVSGAENYVSSGAALATGNWWGCTAGPGAPGCDTINGSVDVSGWLTSAPACVTCLDDSDCDDKLYCDGTESCSSGTCTAPSGDPCTGGSECADTCNESADNCNDLVGTACTDEGNVCTTNACDGSGTCAATNNTLPCDDNAYCNGADTCGGGSCSVHVGDPCSGGSECANSCNESADNCNDLAGTVCTDDGNGCTTNACDGSGTCAATNNTLPCDDGTYCNGTDTCAAGACTTHAGDPCPGADGDGNCAESCNETADNCTLADTNGSACNDGTYCNGTDTCAAGSCATHTGDPCLAGGECANACNESVDNCYDLAGTTCTDDGNICTTNACNGAGACAATNNTLPCDDGVTCTIADTCTAGTCVGDGPLTGALCSWSMAVRKDAAGGDHIETGVSATVVGDVCASQLVLGTLSSSDSNVVATNATNNATIRIGSGAEISGDIVSGGGGAKGRPAAVKLPYTDVVSLSGGSILAKNDSTGDYDLSGDHPLVAGCTSAQNGYAGAVSAVAALGSDMSLPPIVLNAGETATVLAPHPGAVNVIDVEDVRGKSNTTLELDAGGNADTTIVLRIAGSLHMASGSSIALVGGLTADRVLIRVLGRKCDLGNNFLGAGTLLCPNARIQVDYDGIWTGSLFAGKKVLRVGDRVELNYSPFLAF